MIRRSFLAYLVSSSALMTPLTAAAAGAVLGMAADELVLEPRRAAEATALRATLASLAGRTTPSDWPVAVRLSPAMLDRMLAPLSGTTAVFDDGGMWSGTRLTLRDIRLAPGDGMLRADLVLRAEAPGRWVGLDLRLEAVLRFAGYERREGRLQACFSLDPTSIAPAVRPGLLEIAPRTFWAKLFADLLPAFFAEKRLPAMSFPVPEEIALPLQLDDRPVVQKTQGGSVTLRTRLVEASVLRLRLGYGAPVMTRNGVWLVADIGTSHAAIATARPSVPVEEASIEDARSQLATKLAMFTSGKAADIGLHLGRRLFDGLKDRIAALPQPARTIEVRALAVNGPLSVTDHGSALGRVRYAVELNGADRFVMDALMGAPQLEWAPRGAIVALPVNMKLTASMKLHIDPGPGGGIGPVVGVEGHGRAMLRFAIAPRLADTPAGPVALLGLEAEGTRLDVSASTDGKFKSAGFSINVPKVGVNVQADMGAGRVGSATLFDARPNLVRFDPATASHWTVTPGAAAIIVRAVPRAIDTGTDGADMSLDLDVVTVPNGAALAAAAAAVQAESDRFDAEGRRLSAGDRLEIRTTMRPVIAGIEIGPNGEIARAVDGVARRIRREINPAKIDGWVRDPGRSLMRSDLNPVNAVGRGLKSIGRRIRIRL